MSIKLTVTLKDIGLEGLDSSTPDKAYNLRQRERQKNQEKNQKSPKKGSKSPEVLAVNETIATFTQLEHVPCHFRTALCPDRCNHATDVAVFKIDQYVKYEKLGKYGDDKVEEFYWDLKPTAESSKLHPEYLEQVKALKPGEKVKLNWSHFYVSEDGVQTPERSVTFFAKI
ncbi:hypothetical protein M9Y10_010606 [Tritrichomonas musculus]|uniref:Uncharacterized protein n=1 Tax=Tritrichomonas musculus TaxID=1915356 RepID=A0ABR2ILA1_9EUKA